MIHLSEEDDEYEMEEIDMPDGIIAHLSRECDGNVDDHDLVVVTSGSFEEEPCGANPYSGAYCHWDTSLAKNAAEMEEDSRFESAYREEGTYIPDTKNNWICDEFKKRMIAPTHYTIRSDYGPKMGAHLKSWLIQTSTDGKSWREVACEEGNEQLNGKRFTCTFPVARSGACRFIRLVNMGKNHHGSDQLVISAWEIFGSLIESPAESFDALPAGARG
jgi:hypothetical protein